MPGTEELMARLSQLEQGYYGDKEAERQKKFFDTYGARFSNNHGLGLAILNELDARGIDTSAADEAVQEILDTLRTECNEIIESIKDVQQQAIENAQKVETVANVVSEAVTANPEAAATADTSAINQSMPEMEVPPNPAVDAVNSDGEFNPDEVPPEPPAETSTEEVPPEPPAETPTKEVPPEPPAETSTGNDVISDARMKRIQRMKANWGKTRPMKEKEEGCGSSDCFKPSAGMFEAAMRGY